MTRGTLRRASASLLMLLLPLVGSGCNLLDVNDPTAVEEKDYTNAAGANMLRRDALTRLYDAMSYAAFQSGMFTDEFYYDPRPLDLQSGTMVGNHMLDLRDGLLLRDGQTSKFAYQKRHDTRLGATFAIEWLRKHAPDATKRAHIGQMLLVRGYAVLGLAEDFCAGLPLNEVADYKPVYGAPLSTDELFERALSDLDSAVVYAADSARIADAARVVRARALVGLGRLAEAAASAAPVATNHLWRTEFSSSAGGQSNTQFNFASGASASWTQSVADRDGGNGLDFVSANDPRVKTRLLRTANDGVSRIYAMEKYPDNYGQIVLASGVEARLIEAEAQLAGAAPGDWLTTLNALRTDGTFTTQSNAQDPTKTDTLWRAGTGGVAGLAPLADPGSPEARIDLLFRERAFWLFATGHRLGDLRRLVRHYGRAPESVFPSGAHRVNGAYGTATSIPFPWEDEAAHNPAITGCIG